MRKVPPLHARRRQSGVDRPKGAEPPRTAWLSEMDTVGSGPSTGVRPGLDAPDPGCALQTPDVGSGGVDVVVVVEDVVRVVAALDARGAGRSSGRRRRVPRRRPGRRRGSSASGARRGAGAGRACVSRVQAMFSSVSAGSIQTDGMMRFQPSSRCGTAVSRDADARDGAVEVLEQDRASSATGRTRSARRSRRSGPSVRPRVKLESQ